MKKLLIILVLLFSFSVIAKEEVLYCTETQKAGFDSDDNYSKVISFTEDRYTINIDFQNKSLDMFETFLWSCDILTEGDQMQCIFGGYSFYININTYKFTLAKGFEYVASENDSVNIAYGTCEKF